MWGASVSAQQSTSVNGDLLLSVLDESSVRIFDSMKGSEEVKGGLGRGPEGVVGLLGLVVPMLGYRF